MTTKKILVVEDEETLCEILQFNLENEGYEVVYLPTKNGKGIMKIRKESR